MAFSLTGKKLFGAGRFFGINNVSNPTPTRLAVPQDTSVQMKRQVKELFGENIYAEDTGVGETSITGKITFGQSNARLFADLMLGVSGAAGQILEADNELGTIATSAITVTNSATWTTDLGVVNTTNGQRYAAVAGGSEVAGKSYSVAAGVYTFAAGETGTTFKISYLYTAATTGEKMTVSNQPMGRIGGFTGVHVFPWTNPSNVQEQDVLTLNNCVASDTELMGKVGDFGKPTLSYTASVDTSDDIGTFSFAEAA